MGGGLRFYGVKLEFCGKVSSLVVFPHPLLMFIVYSIQQRPVLGFLACRLHVP